MGYFEEKKGELNHLLYLLQEEKGKFQTAVGAKSYEFEEKERELNRLREGVDRLAKERQIGFPWLAKAYQELYEIGDDIIVKHLRTKARSAARASEEVKKQARLRREAEYEKKVAQYLVQYYESIAPFLLDLKEEVEIPTAQDIANHNTYSEEERDDGVTSYLTIEEYRKLPVSERNQIALDRYWKRPKSKWQIGKIYERYVGYLYEMEGYEVEYKGIIDGLEDLGRDLICSNKNEVIVIQCKYWSQFRTIYEKHIFQFFGTVFKYRDDNKGKKVRAIFYTSTKLSDLARRFASELGIELKENEKFEKSYPSIKCNISNVGGERIYHLPMDQQYDKVKIEPSKGEFYCSSVKEAEEKGFRRAYKYGFSQDKS